jgi:hypothetical protein
MAFFCIAWRTWDIALQIYGFTWRIVTNNRLIDLVDCTTTTVHITLLYSSFEPQGSYCLVLRR